MHLTQLQDQDPQCVFIARRISGMGFQSQEILASHFGQYGKVLRVMVAHSKVKPFRRPGTVSRVRPGSLGFVVMEVPENVEIILAMGTEQVVAGHRISVERFEQIAKPRDGHASSNGDSTTSAGDSVTPGSGSRAGTNGSGSENSGGSRADSGSNGSEEGSDKGNGFFGDNASQPKAEGSSEDCSGDSQSESSNRATSPQARPSAAREQPLASRFLRGGTD